MSKSRISIETAQLLRKNLEQNEGLERYAAYQNLDFGHEGFGHVQFLALGPEFTFQEAPERLPDTHDQINWRYVHVGYFDPDSGKVVEA